MTNENAPSLGEIADILIGLRNDGVTRESILYVVDKVWWQEAAVEHVRSAQRPETD